MTRIIHAEYALLTPFDLRAHIFMVVVEFALYYHEHHHKHFEVTYGHF